MPGQIPLVFFAYDWDELVFDCLAGKPKVTFQGTPYYFFRGGKPYYRTKVEILHRAIWKFCYGSIPPGYDIHHRDHNSRNNHPSNLVSISRAEHLKHHHSTRSKKEDRRIVDLYSQLESIYKVGEMVDRAPSFVCTVLNEYGVERDGNPSTRSEENDQWFIELYGQLKSITKVGEVVGRSGEFIRSILNEYGIALDGHGPNLTDQQIAEIKVLLRKGDLTQRVIAHEFDTNRSTISQINTGNYRNGGYQPGGDKIADRVEK
ncbi:hypothetical protein LCGC14_0610170 [marine sediment metagenome]|uniref:HNH nuclease domain-containing protein n=1 Tax=marine sediment metagenome TaxID=412755 RepID=A0A0F9RCN0_9ZZZZ